MCGIAGMVRFDGLTPNERGIGATMANTLRHRGPDEAGQYDDRFASLGHARLSIIDLENGRQPISNEDQTIQVIFNGEIYNYRSLANDLRARGHRLKTNCDSEVLVHLYEDYGDSFVEHLNGMFAIAVWDIRKRQLILVRDRIGIKPLYWHHDGKRILFGSELKALLAAGNLQINIDPCAVQDYFTFGHIPAPRTIFSNSHKLEPGCLAICTDQGVSIRRYWDITFDDEELPAAISSDYERRWIDEFADLLEDAVSMRLVADVPLGAFLSGGVDSAAVTTAMQRQSRGTVLTQTVGFDEADHDERNLARETAELLGTNHREVIIRPDAAAAAEQLARHFDEPFADSSAIPTFYLSQTARQRVTVALAGDGGDEMLAGYRRYRFDMVEGLLRARCPSWLRRSTAGVAGWLYPKADWLPRPLRAKRTLQNIACDDATAHLRSVAIQAGTLPHRLMNSDILEQTRDYDPFMRGRELFARCSSAQLLNRFLYVDMKTLMVDDILTKVDRASMAVGLEVRVPLLDHRVVEMSARMPAELKLNGAQNKYILRKVLAGWIGSQASERPKKGFDVPMDAWFRGPLREMAHDMLTSSNTLCREWVKPKVIDNIMTNHQHRLQSNGHLLWTLLSLELWARAYADRATQPSLHPSKDHHRAALSGVA